MPTVHVAGSATLLRSSNLRRLTGFDAAASIGGSAQVQTAAAVADSGQSAFVGREVTKSERPELTAAKFIVSCGRALGSAEKFTEVMPP